MTLFDLDRALVRAVTLPVAVSPGRGGRRVQGPAAGGSTSGSAGASLSDGGSAPTSASEGESLAGGGSTPTSAGNPTSTAGSVVAADSEPERASGSDLDDEAAAGLFAAAAWSTITEPGDAVAGLFTSGLGAVRALSMLIERRAPDEWCEALGEEYESEVTAADVGSALERWRPRLVSRAVLEALRAAARFEAQLLLPDDPLWPAGCHDLGPHAPHALWVRGSVRAVDHPSGSIAIVGSRDATNYGEHVAMELASGLSDRGFAIVSGAAYGIDGMAHRAALVSGGTTVAFLAGGVDRLYPAAHHDLLLRVAASGAIVSELPCGSSPTKWRFLQRNRLIAATSRATVVVEAGRRSGSLNTAGHAAALGRPLGAVPGPVTSVTSAGCHRLLREFDATCVTSAAEVMELVLGPAEARPTLFDDAVSAEAARGAPSTAAVRAAPSTAAEAGQLPPAETEAIAVRVIDALSRRSRRSVDDIAARSGLSVRSVEAMLGILGLEGRARETETGWVRT